MADLTSLKGIALRLPLVATVPVAIVLLLTMGAGAGSLGLPDAKSLASNDCPVEDDFPISQAPDWQTHPAAAYENGGDSYMVVWEEGRGSNVDIYARRVPSVGMALDSEFPVSVAPDVQSKPDLDFDDNAGQFLVVWEDHRGEDWDIYGQRIGEGLLGSNFPVVLLSGDQRTPAIACGDQVCLVVWEHWNEEDHNSDIVGQLIFSMGEPLGIALYISRADGRQTDPAVVYNTEDKEYQVVWTDRRSGLDSDIYGQRLSSIGDLLGGNFPVSVAEGGQREPDVAYSSLDDRYLVLWEDHRAGNADIYGRLVTNRGELSGQEFPISAAMDWQDRHPAITYHDLANEYLVAWEHTTEGSASSRIYWVPISDDSSQPGDICAVLDSQYDQSYPAVASGRRIYEHLLAWQDLRNLDTTAWDIFGQRAAALSGTPTATVSTTPVSTATPTATLVPTGTVTPTPTSTPPIRERHLLPLILKNHSNTGTLALCNGGFETGNFACWSHGGVLDSRVAGSDDPFNPFGSFAARLGEPDYPQGYVPVGRAWMSQVVTVPSSSSKLQFSAFVYSYDIKGYDEVEYDSLDVSVDDRAVLVSIGNPAESTNCDRLWQSGIIIQSIDLSEYGISAGDAVQIRFSNWNRTAPECNTWSYVDDVRVIP